MMNTEGKFYLGRLYDLAQGRAVTQPLLYDPDDLTTHAVVVGMTGSGKTGLCITLMEEAALNGVPALMIDPKGDITNALLHFPNLAPQDFQPWVNPDEARRQGLTIEAAAAQAAERWRVGLGEWDLSPERLSALAQAVEFAVYTPGSDAGLPVSILASLKAPPSPAGSTGKGAWEGNREALRERISGTVTALLGLVGFSDIDPVRSREHILLANIFEYAWSRGKDLDLGEIILQTQNPPFPKLGVFDVNTFFPEKDRFALAMQLNNILAAPSFAAWIEGQPLDIPALLWAPDGRPRHSVFYIAHLSDAERMFFVTLLYSAVESWMRSQPGSPTLRAIVYFDEIFGYLPPISNPPSKAPMLRMLKQSRAFGVSQVLATQNPVDIDYKGLSNAGTWLIGKLQTERDKARLLDGLESASPGGLDRGEYDRLISSLGKRVFLLHNIHHKPSAQQGLAGERSGVSSGALIFQTRQAMNYLPGPLTRSQIPALNALAGARLPAGSGSPISKEPPTEPASLDEFQPIAVEADTQPLRVGGPQATETRPALPAGVKEFFLPNNLTFTQALRERYAGAETDRPFPQEAFSQGLIYRPAILAQAQVQYLQRKYELDQVQTFTALVRALEGRGLVRWENHLANPVDPDALDPDAAPGARFAALDAPFSDAKAVASLGKDFVEWVSRSARIKVRANESLDVYAGPEVTLAEFHQRCAETAKEGRDAELDKVAATFDRKLETLRTRLDKEERELEEDESDLNNRKWEERGSLFETGAGLLGLGRKRSVSSHLSKRRMTEKAKADVEESKDVIEDLEQQIAELEKEKQSALEGVDARWNEIANTTTEIPVTPLKKDIVLELFGVAWVPFHLVKSDGEVIELPGYKMT